MTTGPITLAYGSEHVRLGSVPGRYAALTATLPSVLRDPATSLRQALDAPIASPPLRALVRPGDRVTIVVSDGTRVTGVRTLLPTLLAYLDSAGVPPARVRVLFALGIHRAQTEGERAAILGAEVAARVTHADHACDDERTLTTLASVGPTAGIRVNRQVLEGDLVIVTGAITFHYLAGFGGGRKAILPGVAARESVRAFHSRSLASEADAGRHPCVALGIRAGNPLDELATAAAATLPRAFLINTVVAPRSRSRMDAPANGARSTGRHATTTGEREAGARLLAIVAGDVRRAFDRGCEIYRTHFAVPIAGSRPVVIVSAGGAPRDRDLVQAQKAIAAGAAALAPGGAMLVLAACPEGAGQNELMQWFGHRDRAAHLAALRRGFSVPGQTALALREHAERYRIYLRSELPAETVERTGMIPLARAEDFFTNVARRYGDEVEGYLLPDGARYLPVIGAS